MHSSTSTTIATSTPITGITRGELATGGTGVEDGDEITTEVCVHIRSLRALFVTGNWGSNTITLPSIVTLAPLVTHSSMKPTRRSMSEWTAELNMRALNTILLTSLHTNTDWSINSSRNSHWHWFLMTSATLDRMRETIDDCRVRWEMQVWHRYDSRCWNGLRGTYIHALWKLDSLQLKQNGFRTWRVWLSFIYEETNRMKKLH